MGRKGTVTLGRVIFDVHVKALTRGMWPACTLESGSRAAQHRGQVVMQSQRVLLICSHYVLVWCHTRMPPVAPTPLPHPSAEMTLVSEGRIHLQCVLYNISLTMQSWIRDICDESFIKPPPIFLFHVHRLSGSWRSTCTCVCSDVIAAKIGREDGNGYSGKKKKKEGE